MSCARLTVLVATVLVVLCALVHFRSGGGGMVDAYAVSGKLGMCGFDSDLQLLCEKCSKAMRSFEVYKKCCASSQQRHLKGDAKSVSEWCQEFLNYDMDSFVN